MFKWFFLIETLFVSFSRWIGYFQLEGIPRSAGANRSGLGVSLFRLEATGIAERLSRIRSAFGFQYFSSTKNLSTVEKHVRNKLQDTKDPTVPAIRTGQDRNQVYAGPDPYGWKIQNTQLIKHCYAIYKCLLSVLGKNSRQIISEVKF